MTERHCCEEKKGKLLAEGERNATKMAGQVKSVRKKNRLVRSQLCAGFLGDLPSTARLSLTILGSSSWDNVLTTHRAGCCLGLNSQIDLRYYILEGEKTTSPSHTKIYRDEGTSTLKLKKEALAGFLATCSIFVLRKVLFDRQLRVTFLDVVQG